MPCENVDQRVAGADLVTHHVLSRDLLERLLDHRLHYRLWHDHRAVEIAEHQVAAFDANT